jgi:hypothetical protein
MVAFVRFGHRHEAKLSLSRAFRNGELLSGRLRRYFCPAFLPDTEKARVGELRFLAERLACQVDVALRRLEVRVTGSSHERCRRDSRCRRGLCALGGYPVLKKWLSYRERDVLGRDLEVAEARHFTGMARRITAIVLMGAELDAQYAAVVEGEFDWERMQPLEPGAVGEPFAEGDIPGA